MKTTAKLLQGTSAWLDMVGQLLCKAASTAPLPPDLTVSLAERYIDGADLQGGLVQGIRFQIVNGVPSFKVGVRRDETADIVIEVSAAAARQLNLLKGADFAAAQRRYIETGEMRVHGDANLLGGGWLDEAHDQIVERTM